MTRSRDGIARLTPFGLQTFPYRVDSPCQIRSDRHQLYDASSLDRDTGIVLNLLYERENQGGPDAVIEKIHQIEITDS